MKMILMECIRNKASIAAENGGQQRQLQRHDMMPTRPSQPDTTIYLASLNTDSPEIYRHCLSSPI
jgi:hypothetical protein